MTYNNDSVLWQMYRRNCPKEALRVSQGHIVQGCEALARCVDDAEAREILHEAGYVEVRPNEFVNKEEQ